VDAEFDEEAGMWTASQLGREVGLSRTAVLYYERIGLLPQVTRRSAGSVRCYGQAELDRLRRICGYRAAGLKLGDIAELLGGETSDAAQVLEGRLREIEEEIAALGRHRMVLARLLGNALLRKDKMITKEKWVAIMSSSGFSDEQMWAWHKEFERAAPEEHQEFLEFLHIAAEEIATIRAKSRE